MNDLYILALHIRAGDLAESNAYNVSQWCRELSVSSLLTCHRSPQVYACDQMVRLRGLHVALMRVGGCQVCCLIDDC